jgi:hypothetical protein
MQAERKKQQTKASWQNEPALAALRNGVEHSLSRHAAPQGVAREIRARRRVRGQLRPGSPVYLALMAVTLVMELDLWLFGWMRCGSYFILVEKSH